MTNLVIYFTDVVRICETFCSTVISSPSHDVAELRNDCLILKRVEKEKDTSGK